MENIGNGKIVLKIFELIYLILYQYEFTLVYLILY